MTYHFLILSICIFLIRIIFLDQYFFFKILIDAIKQSNTIVDLIKGLVILPKSLFLVKSLKHKKNSSYPFTADYFNRIYGTSTFLYIRYPWSYTLHTSEILNSNYKRSILFYSQSATVCRTISQTTFNDLSNFIGSSLSEKVVMVHLGVDVKGFKKKTSINDPFVIATPAELTTRKGHVYAIEAAQILVDLGITNFKWFWQWTFTN